MGAQRAGIELSPASDNHLAGISLDLDHVERRARGHAQSLALAHGEVVDAAMLAHDFAVGGDQFAGSVGQGLALLRQIGVEKLLVIAAGNKADFLRIGLLGQSQSMPLGPARAPQASSFRPEGNSVRLSCVLGQAEEEIGLVLGAVGRTLEQPAAELLVELHARVVAGGQRIGPNLLGHNQ